MGSMEKNKLTFFALVFITKSIQHNNAFTKQISKFQLDTNTRSYKMYCNVTGS